MKKLLTEKQTLDTLIKGSDALEAVNWPFWLAFGVLLGLIRDGKLMPNPDVDVLCWGKDIPKERFYVVGDKLKESPENRVVKCLSLVQNVHHIDGRYDIFPLYKKGDICFSNLENNDCLIWPAYHFDGYEEITIGDRKWRVPIDPEGWLETYYGNWKIVNKDWEWHKDAKNIVNIKDIN